MTPKGPSKYFCRRPEGAERKSARMFRNLFLIACCAGMVVYTAYYVAHLNVMK
jgi:hypothetical protein